MTVESLLKTISEGMTVNVKDCYGNMIIRFKFGDDIEVFSASFLFHKIKKTEIKNQFDAAEMKIWMDDEFGGHEK